MVSHRGGRVPKDRNCNTHPMADKKKGIHGLGSRREEEEEEEAPPSAGGGGNGKKPKESYVGACRPLFLQFLFFALFLP